MAVFRFTIDEHQCGSHPTLAGMLVEVEYFSARGPLDESRLMEWAVMIAVAIVDKELSHKDLLEESVHIRLVSSDGEIVNTISHRTKLSK